MPGPHLPPAPPPPGPPLTLGSPLLPAAPPPRRPETALLAVRGPRPRRDSPAAGERRAAGGGRCRAPEDRPTRPLGALAVSEANVTESRGEPSEGPARSAGEGEAGPTGSGMLVMAVSIAAAGVALHWDPATRACPAATQHARAIPAARRRRIPSLAADGLGGRDLPSTPPCGPYPVPCAACERVSPTARASGRLRHPLRRRRHRSARRASKPAPLKTDSTATVAAATHSVPPCRRCDCEICGLQPRSPSSSSRSCTSFPTRRQTSSLLDPQGGVPTLGCQRSSTPTAGAAPKPRGWKRGW